MGMPESRRLADLTYPQAKAVLDQDGWRLRDKVWVDAPR